MSDSIEKVYLQWTDFDGCFVWVSPDNDEDFGAGAVYLINGEPHLETPPFSVEITLSQLKSLVELLEKRKDELPLSKSLSL